MIDVPKDVKLLKRFRRDLTSLGMALGDTVMGRFFTITRIGEGWLVSVHSHIGGETVMYNDICDELMPMHMIHPRLPNNKEWMSYHWGNAIAKMWFARKADGSLDDLKYRMKKG